MEQDSYFDMVVLEFSSGFDTIKHILKKKIKKGYDSHGTASVHTM